MTTHTIETLFSQATQFPEALCREVDPELFFADTRPGKRMSAYQKQAAKSICHQCVHEKECLTYALENDEQFGIWGGLDEDERRELMYPHPVLSSREQQIVRLHEQGLTTRQIADRLNLSVQSVWQYHKNAQKKSAA